MMQWQSSIHDPALFVQEEFNQALAAVKSPLLVYKDYLQNCSQYLIEEFDAGHPIKELLYKRAWFIDELLTQAWIQHIDRSDLALVAVGGYGRGELHPGSDIDIMILTKPRLQPEIKVQIEKFLVFLWDIGLEIGHSVRTIKDCHKEAKTDITVVTNLMESRSVTGDVKLYQSMISVTGPQKIWPPRKFFEAKCLEQQSRHKKYDQSEHTLEPNIKEGPGGLRDIQMVDWVAKRHFGANRLSQLVSFGFLTQSEYDSLAEGRDLLWRVRFALHILTGRREDRLLFDHQRAVAKTFGYESDDNSAIEQFMKRYYKTIRELNLLNEILLQHFQEAILYAHRKEKIKALSKRFQIRNDFIEVSDNWIFKRYPFALLEIFLLIQQNPSIKGVRASTIRLVRESMGLINDNFRNDIRNKSLFMEIIKQPKQVGHELRRMHRYGVLSAYLPEFAAIEGLMQFDLFHVYTVDEHILFVVRNMRFFAQDDYQEQFPHCQHVLKDVPKQELLYLAGMFHDIAKGRGGSHSELGEEIVLSFCQRHQLPKFDAKLVAWLVKNHLSMSMTAQRKDINDPEVIQKFAEEVGDIMHLRYLYLLTVADISGTNPKMWNSWKASLIAELFHKTRRALRRGLENPIEKTQRIKETKDSAISLIGRTSIYNKDIETLWDLLGEDYFIRYSAEEIAWQTRAIGRAREETLPLLTIKPETYRGGTEIFVYMHNRDNVFSRTTSTLDNLRLNIVDARIITSTHGYTLDTFIVLEDSGEPVKGKERKNAIKAVLTKELQNLDNPPRAVSRRDSRLLRNFPIPTQVKFSADEKNCRTIMEVTATDRGGFLSKVGSALEQCQARIQNAKIATYGERVEDIFFITDKDNKMIKNKQKLDELRDKITDLLDNH